jgi:hypothetical protein
VFDLELRGPKQGKVLVHGSFTDVIRLDIGAIKTPENRHPDPAVEMSQIRNCCEKNAARS